MFELLNTDHKEGYEFMPIDSILKFGNETESEDVERPYDFYIWANLDNVSRSSNSYLMMEFKLQKGVKLQGW